MQCPRNESFSVVLRDEHLHWLSESSGFFQIQRLGASYLTHYFSGPLSWPYNKPQRTECCQQSQMYARCYHVGHQPFPLVFHPTITWLLLRQSLVERWWTLVLKGCQVLSIKEAVPLSVLWSVTPEACHLERAIISSFSSGWVNHLHCDLHVGT